MSNEPSSRVSSAMKTASRRKSPISSSSARRSLLSMASTTSYASSITNGLSDSSVCLRSHGQPSGPRSLVINFTRSSNERLGIHGILTTVSAEHARPARPRAAAGATIPYLGYPMSNQVLIVAGESAARIPARVALSLRLEPIIAGTEEEALALIDAHSFSLVAVGDDALWQRMREIIEARRPMTRVLRLPEGNGGDDLAVRRLLTRYLDPHTKAAPHQFSEKR